MKGKQVHSDNVASEVDIWDILGQFGRFYDEFGALRLFSQSFLTIFTHNWLIEKNAFRTDPRTDGRTDIHSYRDVWMHLKIYCTNWDN